jgi:hypothetical protein
MAAGSRVDGEVVADVFGGEISFANEGGPDVAPRTFAPADTRHPVFRAFADRAATLGLVKLPRVVTISAAGCQTLARFTTGEAALVDCGPGKGRALVFASDFDNEWNDFPLHSAFVPFLHESVRYLAGGPRPASEYLVGRVPPGVPATPGIATLAQPSENGGMPRRIAVNVDPVESEPGRLSVEEFETAVTRLQDGPVAGQRVDERQQEARQHIWQYLLALAIGIMIMESLVAAWTGGARMRESR